MQQDCKKDARFIFFSGGPCWGVLLEEEVWSPASKNYHAKSFEFFMSFNFPIQTSLNFSCLYHSCPHPTLIQFPALTPSKKISSFWNLSWKKWWITISTWQKNTTHKTNVPSQQEGTLAECKKMEWKWNERKPKKRWNEAADVAEKMNLKGFCESWPEPPKRTTGERGAVPAGQRAARRFTRARGGWGWGGRRPAVRGGGDGQGGMGRRGGGEV